VTTERSTVDTTTAASASPAGLFDIGQKAPRKKKAILKVPLQPLSLTVLADQVEQTMARIRDYEHCYPEKMGKLRKTLAAKMARKSEWKLEGHPGRFFGFQRGGAG
jgi:hypothetical protein